MIQDIAPHRYDNAFKKIKPKAEDYVFCIRKNQILLPKETEKRAEGREIPVFSEISVLAADAVGRAEYLFSIDEKPYFLLEMDEDPDFSEDFEIPFEWKKTQHMRFMEPRHQAFAAITATQIYRWRSSRRYCGHCGAKTVNSQTERALVCPVCGQTEYPKISPAIIVAVTDGDRILMSRYRTNHSSYRGYALIAGFVEIGETFEETVSREVMEEVGLKVKNIRYFKSQPWAFTDTEMIGFFADLDGDDKIRLEEDELSEAGWYTREEVPDEERFISVGTELKMYFKYGPEWEKILREKKSAISAGNT